MLTVLSSISVKRISRRGEAGWAAQKSTAQLEQEFRKRQLEAQKASEKDEKARQDADAKKENCERARNALRMLESGQRIARVDKQGERYYIDEAQVEQESERARQAVQQSCN